MADTILSRGPANVTTLITTTLENRRGQIQDNIFNDLATTKYLYDKKKIRVEGGATIIQALMYAANGTSQFYQGYDTLNTTPAEGFTQAQFQWKEAAASISVSNREETIQNTGSYAQYNIVKAKTDQAEMDLRKAINDSFFVASPTAKQMTSLVTLIDTTSTIGDVNSTSATWWAANVTTSGSFAAQGRSDMLTLFNLIVTKGGKTDGILTTPTVHGFYEGSLVPQLRYTSNTTGNNSFESLKFKTAEMFFDTACTSGVMYFLDSNHVELLVNSNNDFRMTEWVKPSSQTAKVAQLLVALELTTNNRRRLGKLTTITA